MANKFVYKDGGFYDAKIKQLNVHFTVLSTQTTNVLNYKVSNVEGNGIANVALVGTGVYQITLADNYIKYLGLSYEIQDVIGTPVAIASLSNGVPYVISTVGTSALADWQLAGLGIGITPAVGVAFNAVTAASGSGGNGFAAPQTPSGIAITTFGVPDGTINPAQPNASVPYFMIQCLNDTNSSTTTKVATTPPDNTSIRLRLLFRDSTVTK